MVKQHDFLWVKPKCQSYGARSPIQLRKIKARKTVNHELKSKIWDVSCSYIVLKIILFPDKFLNNLIILFSYIMQQHHKHMNALKYVTNFVSQAQSVM